MLCRYWYRGTTVGVKFWLQLAGDPELAPPAG